MAAMSSRQPVVVAYQADWPARAARLISALDHALGGAVDRIEHIGSTAIPGMAAKDVLDLQASVPDLEVADAALEEPLAWLGFVPFARPRRPRPRRTAGRPRPLEQASVDTSGPGRR